MEIKYFEVNIFFKCIYNPFLEIIFVFKSCILNLNLFIIPL